jgi:ABC-type transport system involved in multi-copper enzyme maturation permease subunit
VTPAQIRDRGYQRYAGQYTEPRGRWAIIARHTLGLTARQPWVIVLLVVAAFPALIGGVVLWVQSKLVAAAPPGSVPSPDPLILLIAVRAWGTLLIAFLMALFAGGSAIADDARTGAFQLYFARPISRAQYLLGKLAAVALLVGIVALAPSLLLASLRVALQPTFGAALARLPLVLAALALGLVEALVFAAPALALSSLSRSRSYAQGAFAALFLVPWILGLIFVRVTGSPWPQALSIPTHLENIGRWLYRLPSDDDTLRLPLWLSALVLAALVSGSLQLVRRRLASVEVIAS